MPRELTVSILIAFAAAGVVVYIIRDLSTRRKLARDENHTISFLVGCILIVVVVVTVCVIAAESSIPDSPVATLLSDFFGQ
jgi:O-antigen/teichoic acid export membrane protein